MKRVLIFAERVLPSTQTFIPIQVNSLNHFTPQYVGLIPAIPSFPLPHSPILLTKNRHLTSRFRRELYRWTGIAPSYHACLRACGASLIHAHFAESAGAAVSTAESLDIPLIMHLRGGAEMHDDATLRHKLFQWPYLVWRRHLWKRASLFLCVSEFIRRKAIEAGFPENKLRVHYTGIDLNVFSPNSSPPKRDVSVVLYVGRLVEYKGAAHLIRAMHIVRQANSNARVVIIGDGDYRNSIVTLANELSVPCEFLGEQPATVVRDWMERARVFCAPSMTLKDGMSEAFGNVFTEAQAMGLPVVSYRHGGIPETMLDGRTGLLAEEYDYHGLATNIMRYLKDDIFWQSSHEYGMQWVRDNFDVQVQTQKLENIYEEAITNYGTPFGGCQICVNARDKKSLKA